MKIIATLACDCSTTSYTIFDWKVENLDDEEWEQVSKTIHGKIVPRQNEEDEDYLVSSDNETFLAVIISAVSSEGRSEDVDVDKLQGVLDIITELKKIKTEVKPQGFSFTIQS